MGTESSFRRKWINFFKAVGSPVPIISFIGAGVLMGISIFYKDKQEFSILINLIGSLLLGVTGAFIKGGYDDLSGESMLVKKGQSAIRNLSSINHQVIQIRNWIGSFIKKDTVSKRELEEINRHLETTIININSGLSDWTDIVPELKQTEEVVKTYESVIKAYIEELLKNKKELIAAGENKELRERLEKQIKDLEKKVKDLREEQPGIFGSGLIASPSPASYASVTPLNVGTLSGIFNKTCSSCGRVYEDDVLATTLNVNMANLCPTCKKKIQQ